MFFNKQSKSSLLTWIAVDIAFLIIVIVLLATFMHNGRKNAVTQCRNNLVWQVEDWADTVREIRHQAEAAAGPFVYNPSKLTDHVSKKDLALYLQGMRDNTSFAHVCLFDGQDFVCDESGSDEPPIAVVFFEKEGYKKPTTVILPSVGETGDAIMAVCIPLGEDKSFLVFSATLSELDEYFSSFSYPEFFFLALVNSEGKVLGTFNKYTDLSSRYLSSDNLIGILEKNSNSDDYYLFKGRFIGRLDCSVAADLNGDKRTFAFAPVADSNLFLAMGIRQDYFERMCEGSLSETRKTTVRLGSVIVMFVIFVFGTLLFSSLRHKEQGKQLEDKADTDLLTDLNNKLATERKIQEYLDSHPDEKSMLFIFDVDNFKKINDTMGHAFGDLVLKTIGKDIRLVFRASDVIGRIGGDEFVIFLKNISDDAQIIDEAKRLTTFFHDFKAGGDYVKYSATASIGVAVYPGDAKNFKSLYEAADQALYRSKKRGKNQLTFFNEELYGGSIKS